MFSRERMLCMKVQVNFACNLVASSLLYGVVSPGAEYAHPLIKVYPALGVLP